MSLVRSIVGGVRSLFRRKMEEQELSEELNAFLEMAVEEKTKQGMGRQEALRAVRLERGSAQVAKEVVRDSGWESAMETSWQDVRFGMRMYASLPGSPPLL